MTQRINQAGLDLIKSFEGLRLDAYRDPVGIWTIGYGTTRGVRAGMRITEKMADELLLADVAYFEQIIRSLVKVPLTGNEFSALVSFVYNLGEWNLSRSTLLQKLNAGDKAGAASEFLKWNKGKIGGRLRTLRGLTRRREAEMTLFLSADHG